ncbi:MULTISPECIES: GH12 family glycosyl hydrolase domain-containing protein [unclassified Streptomyces]|uniref:GH12 family glycosyl hydrolase domain-containing protein n=1 Tax=unclassified Streptomyces TaxID=2593676 RepID=UPI002E175510
MAASRHRRPRLSRRLKLAAAAATALATGATVSVAMADESAKLCDAYATVTMGKYYVNNNLWGQDKATGSQCMWSNSQSGDTISWATEYDWANNSAGHDYDVKSYVSSVLGWHWGWKVDKSATGLPTRVGDKKDIRSTWKFGLNADPGTMNVAYDLWFHAKDNADWQDGPTDEVMIWLNRQGGAGPLGTKEATVSLGGATWDLYKGNVGWNVYSFVRTANTTSATLDLDDFNQALVARGLMSGDKYLSGIEAGTEVFKGKGKLSTDAYSVNVG